MLMRQKLPDLVKTCPLFVSQEQTVVSDLGNGERAVRPFREIGLHRVNWLAPDAFQFSAPVGNERGDGSFSALGATADFLHRDFQTVGPVSPYS
jgi:hypothetical protein